MEGVEGGRVRCGQHPGLDRADRDRCCAPPDLVVVDAVTHEGRERHVEVDLDIFPLPGDLVVVGIVESGGRGARLESELV